jgi:SAM-dependent methyltransferase
VADDDYVQRNVAAWQSREGPELAMARGRWAGEPCWGIFAIPEAVAGVLPADVSGMDVVELGCGTGYVSAWLARRGARPVALDPTPTQLANAARCQEEFGIRFPLLRAVGERVPLRGGSFDLAISEYGAAIWADPYAWIPEAARLLRPGGELVFLGNSTVLMLCAPDEEGVPATEAMVRPQFGMHRFEWADETPTVEFHLSHGDWIRLLREHGFEVEDLIELRPPPDSTTEYDHVTLEWALRWPVEEVWRARRRGTATVAR